MNSLDLFLMKILRSEMMSLLAYGAHLTFEEYPEFMEIFNKLVQYELVKDSNQKYDNYKLYKCNS